MTDQPCVEPGTSWKSKRDGVVATVVSDQGSHVVIKRRRESWIKKRNFFATYEPQEEGST